MLRLANYITTMIKLGNEMGFGDNVNAQYIVSQTPDNRRKFEIKKLHDNPLEDDEARYELYCYVYLGSNGWELAWTWATELRKECLSTKAMLINAGNTIHDLEVGA